MTYVLKDEEVKFLRELVSSDTPFMLVGTVAAAAQGSNAVTDDIDLWFRRTSDPGLDQAARKVGGIFAWRADPPVLCGENLASFDIVTKMSGLGSFDEEYENALDFPIDDFVIKVLPLDRIITSKTAADRNKDRAALPSLRATLAANKLKID
jgi:predicted nucleotidyltransferase